MSLSELCEMFPDVSDMTLRRDIEYFDKIGAAIKVRGGARSVRFIGDTTEDSVARRMRLHIEEKSKIGKAASEYLEAGRSIFFDAGSTLEHAARYVPNMRMTFTTTSPSVALELCRTGIHVVNIVGGRIDRDNLSVSGIYAMKYLEEMNIDIAFLSPTGLSLDGGFTCGDYSDCELKKLVVKKAHTVVILMDRTKIDKTLPFTFCDMSDVDYLITDHTLPDDLALLASKTKCKIIDVNGHI